MANPGTFDDLLEQLAARHRADLQAAAGALSRENDTLREQLSELRAQLAEQTKLGELQVSTREQSRLSIPPLLNNSSEKEEAGVRSSVHSCGSAAPHVFAPSVMEKKMNQINKSESTKMLRRLQRVLCDDGFLGDVRSEPLQPHRVLDALRQKGAFNYDLEYVTHLLQGLEKIVENVFGRNRSHGPRKSVIVGDCNPHVCISLQDLVNLFMMSAPDLEEIAGNQTAAQVIRLKQTFMTEDLDEIIHRLSALPELQSTSSKLSARIQKLSSGDMDELREMPTMLARTLNTIVGVCVLLSIVFVGIALDNNPDDPMWTFVEGFFAIVFLVEVLVKLYYYGVHQYCIGPDWAFNWLDLVITIFALADLLLSVSVSSSEASAFNGTMVLKSLRLFRLARLLKLFNNSPMLKQLVSMLSGFMIGAPSLMWILLIIIVFIYIIAIGFRSFFVYKYSTLEVTLDELKAKCGAGDFVELDDQGIPLDPECKLYLLYGAEFFGTVPRSMITVFRFMMGDTSTTGGKSLVQAMDTTHMESNSEGERLAVPFYFFYIPFMIIVIFGIFNIITAIFVETTINGLKHSDNRSRRKRFYESNYVQGKLSELVEHIQSLGAEGNAPPVFTRAASTVEIDETAFHELMNNHTVRVLLCDLDVVMDESTCQFHMFDPEGIGQITLPQFLGTLLRLRGEPHKIDLVSNWSSLRALQRNFQEFQQVALTALQQMSIEQHSMNQRLQDIAPQLEGDAPADPTVDDELEQKECRDATRLTPL